MSYTEALHRTIVKYRAQRRMERSSHAIHSLTGKIRECEDELRRVEDRLEAQRIYAEYDAANGYDLDDEGNSYHDYS